MKRIKVTFLDGEVLEGETDSLPQKDSTVFYMRIDGERKVIGTRGLKKIDISDEEKNE